MTIAIKMSETPRPRVVIVGGGFGGLTAAASLKNAPVDITVIDKRNYHLFQPLLYQVATAGLSPAEIAAPIRSILAKQRNARVVMAKVTGIDLARREVVLEERRIGYDYLVLATGARHAYFGRDEWEPFTPGLKKIEDATDIRRRILVALEQAETATEAEERAALLTFVVVGAGPTGVEMAGAIAELAHNALARDFRAIAARQARILLVEAGPRVLAAFPEKFSEVAKRSLEKLGVEVRLGQPVQDCDATSVVVVGNERIPARTVIWAAGVAASPAAKWLGANKDRTGRVMVGPDLAVPGRPEVFVIGDTAHALDSDGKPLPGVAPVAKQQGRYVAGAIAARLANRPALPPFHYRYSGNLATIGRKAAVVSFGRVRLTGFPAWILWSIAHVYFLIGFRNRLVVSASWAWAYVTYQRGARLITGVNL